MPKDPNDIVFFEDRPAVIVQAHCRSGTHFLMNALADCYGYVSAPSIGLDPLNHVALPSGRFSSTRDIMGVYYEPKTFGDYVLEFAKRPLATIVKSHLHVDFFRQALEKILQRYVIFVVHRHPVDTLLSYWRFVGGIEWFEGPKTEDVLDFAKAEPKGGLMRYHMRQQPTMMHRWADDVESWVAAASISPRIVVVRYDELKSNYEHVVRSFAEVLGRQPAKVVRPDWGSSHWIRPHPQKSAVPPDKAALRELCRETIGPAMDRLGYE